MPKNLGGEMLTKKYLVILQALFLVFAFSIITLAQSGVRPTNTEKSSLNALSITAGTTTKIELDTPLSSKLNEVGDEVSARLVSSIFVDGTLILKRGTEFRGHITQISPAKRPQRQASLAIVFDKIVTPNGEQEISTMIKAIDDFANENKLNANDEGKVQGGHSGGRTVGNATTGVILGGAISYPVVIAGGGVGPAIAGPAGGAVAGILLSKGNDIKLFPGTVIRIEFTKPFIIASASSEATIEAKPRESNITNSTNVPQ